MHRSPKSKAKGGDTMNQKLQKLREERDKVRARIEEHAAALEKLKAKEKDYEKKIDDLNNSQILAIAKKHNLSPEQFEEMLEGPNLHEFPDDEPDEEDEE